MNEPALVEINKVSKYYDDRVCALKDIDLSLDRGEWLSIMGPSGSGKTTLLNIIGCLDKPTSGLVRVDGRDVTRLTPAELTCFRRETIGLIFQQFHLIPYLTLLENVMLAQYFHSVADEEEARQALDRVGLGDRLSHLPSQLSGGEQQRGCIARALINQPKLVLADEPTGNLDQHNEEIVMDLFRMLHDEGHAIIVITHDPDIGRLADRQVFLEHGSIADCHQVAPLTGES
ncbi:MAG: GTPase [candidate division Zixibacteria bacterium RBG_16_50_21]|nr:MAG: GTPase [candidate division Zixibacteria bacterium RBG_16_50_21]